MGGVSYQSYLFFLSKMGSGSLTTVIGLGIAVIIYLIMLIVLRIFSKEEYYMMPFGKKFYDFFRNG